MKRNGDNVNNTFTYTGREWDEEIGLYYYRARYYDSNTGRFINEDPIEFEGGINSYIYSNNDPINALDPFGLFQIFINEFGTKTGTAYGATIIVQSDCGTIIVSGSSWPNPNNKNPGIAEGSYSGRYGARAHKLGTQPGVVLNNNGPIPTLGPNPNNFNKPYATYIHIHCGYSSTWRGSAGCITINPKECQNVWDFLKEGETGTVTLLRFNN